MGKEGIVEIFHEEGALIKAKVPQGISEYGMREALRIVGLSNVPPVELKGEPLGSVKDGPVMLDIPPELKNGEDSSWKMVMGIGIVKR